MEVLGETPMTLEEIFVALIADKGLAGGAGA
jgi:hypothetical protein